MGIKTATEISLAEQEPDGGTAEAAAPDLFGEVATPRGRGRPKGARDKETRKWADRIINSGQSPLEFLASVWRDPNEPKKNRLSAAAAALPYVHRKQPLEVEVEGAAMQVAVVIGDPGAADTEDIFANAFLNMDDAEDLDTIDDASEESEENQ